MWEVTIPAGVEEDVQKDKGLICLNIYFCVGPQRAAWRDFGDGSKRECLKATTKEEAEQERRDKDREKMRTRGGCRDERSLTDEEEIEEKLKGGEGEEGQRERG